MFHHLTCLFADDLNCMDVLFDIPFVHLLIKMRGFVLTNGWMVQITAFCVNLAFQKRQLLHFSIGSQSPASTLKVACVIVKVRALSCLAIT